VLAAQPPAELLLIIRYSRCAYYCIDVLAIDTCTVRYGTAEAEENDKCTSIYINTTPDLTVSFSLYITITILVLFGIHPFDPFCLIPLVVKDRRQPPLTTWEFHLLASCITLYLILANLSNSKVARLWMSKNQCRYGSCWHHAERV